MAAENSAFPSYKLHFKNIKIENSFFFFIVTRFLNITVNQINAQKHL